MIIDMITVILEPILLLPLKIQSGQTLLVTKVTPFTPILQVHKYNWIDHRSKHGVPKKINYKY